jgi:hypothetical protein
MIRLRFEFVKKEGPKGAAVYQLLDYRPFPADVLPALLLFVCQEIDKINLPDDNPWKKSARTVLDTFKE